MKEYIARLKLKYDPFEPAAASRNFYAGGERQQLLGELVELTLEQDLMAAVTGPLGSGKSVLAKEFCSNLGAEARCVYVPATLFMNQSQYLEAVGRQLPKHAHIDGAAGAESAISRLCAFAAELDLEAQPLVLVVDDAHELSAEVLELLAQVYLRSARARVSILLLGEVSLLNLLDNSIPAECKDDLRCFELAGFTSEETRDYIAYKLEKAGHAGPVPLAGGIIGRIHNTANGVPGAINVLTVDALDAAEASEIGGFDDDTHFISAGAELDYNSRDYTQIDLDMSAPDDFIPTVEQRTGPQPGDTIDVDRIRAFCLDQRYWIAASVLAAAMLTTIVVWDSADSSVTTPATAAINRIQLPVPQPATLSPASSSPAQPTAAVAAAVNAPAPATLSAPEVLAQPAAPASEPATLAVAAPTVSAPAPAPASKPVARAVTAAPALPAGLTAFEQELLKMPDGYYAIQLLGSHNEASAKQFVAARKGTGPTGYFETRHQDKPWFVVVTGSFSERAPALATIARMPAELQSLQPWVRPVASIKRDIRTQRQLP